MLPYQLTAEDKARFKEDGYWISPKILSDEEIASLREVHARIENGNAHDGDGYTMEFYRHPEDPAALRQLNNGWWVYDKVHDTVTNPDLGKLAADLLEVDSIRLWHDQVISKPGLNGQSSNKGNVGWHQDYAYWQCCNTSNMVTAWIALQDTSLENGGMMTILGSHRWGLIQGSNTFFDQNMEALREKYAAEGREWMEEPCILKAGQVSFHHALTFHGSGENLSDESRLCVIAHYMPGDTRFRSGVQRHENFKYLGPRPKDGQIFDTAYFPLVYSR